MIAIRYKGSKSIYTEAGLAPVYLKVKDAKSKIKELGPQSQYEAVKVKLNMAWISPWDLEVV